MAKSKTKAKKNAFPKRVAGVKLSKKMRKRGASFARFANTPLGAALVAESTVAALRGVLGNEKVRSAAAEAGRDMQRMAMVTAMRIGAVAAAARDAALSQTDDKAPTIEGEDGERQPSRAEQARARRAAEKAERDEREIAH